MRKFLIRVECTSYEDIEVEAENESDAIAEAERAFTCNGSGAAFVETLSVT